jgi:hypothetical protein
MAQTHDDADFTPLAEDSINTWLESLQGKADDMQREGLSQITAGKPDEPTLAEWQAHGVGVRQLPADEHGILRISVGGGDTPVNVNYCAFRGNLGECVSLLHQAIRALETKL